MPKKILLVDDEQVVHATVQRVLNPRYEVLAAFNGIEALENALQGKPDLILLDINMPEKDGRQAIQDLRQRPETKKIPVIMLTGLGQVMDKLAGFELGADDYITKPFDIDVLRARVEKILAKNPS